MTYSILIKISSLIILSIIISAGIIPNTNLLATQIIILLSAFFFSLSILIVFREKFILKSTSYVWFSAACLSAIYIVSSVINGSEFYIINILAPLGIASMIHLATSGYMNAYSNAFPAFIVLVSVVNFIYGITNFSYIENKGIFLNANTSGAFAFIATVTMYYSYLKEAETVKKRGYFLVGVISLTSATLSSSRTSMLTIVAFFLILYILKSLNANIRSILMSAIILFFIIIGFTYVYPIAEQFKWFDYINQTSINYTGKPIFSGRNTLWVQIIDIINQQALIGYGSGVTPESFIYQNKTLSSHNLYLQTALQSGLLGLTALIIFLLSLVNSHLLKEIQGKHNWMIFVSFSFCIFIYQAAEITLTQNILYIGYLQWMALVLIISPGRRKI